MSAHTPPEAHLDEQADLSPEAIEGTLRNLWREVEDQSDDATQVRMLNLLIYLPELPSAEIQSTIATLAVQHPGRTITLVHEDGPPHVEATIACRTGGDRRRACGEQITLRGSVGGQPLHSLAVALLQAGLPVTLWWHGELMFDDHIFQQLAQVADHVLLDTRAWHAPLARLADLAYTARAGGSHLRFSDLRWIELSGWRRIIAQAFDLPSTRAALPNLAEIAIQYGGAQVDPSALLLAGWLLSRLGWSVDTESGSYAGADHRFTARRQTGRNAGELRVVLHPDGGATGINAVQMRAIGDHAASCTFTLTDDAQCVRTDIQAGGSAPFSQVAQVQRRAPAELLGDEITLIRSESSYTGALEVAAGLASSIRL